MLKVYSVWDYVSIDGADWRAVGSHGYMVTDEEQKNKIILDNVSFTEAYEYLQDNYLDGVENETSSILKKSIISVEYHNELFPVSYRKFDTMSYKREFEEFNASVKWLMQRLSAEQFIQYFKERGMNVCPLNTTK